MSMFNTANHIRDFHNECAGFTEDLLMQYLTSSGKTSYEALFDVVKEPMGKTILDLGCGSGPLTKICSEKVGTEGKVIAVDLSIGELNLAKQKVKTNNVSFLCEPAHQLSVNSSSVDIVLCHLALWLMKPLEPIVNEIRRVLKPNGMFACMLGGSNNSSQIYNQYCDLLNQLLQQEVPQYLKDGLQDTCINSASKLHSLFHDGFHIDPSDEESGFTLEFKGQPKKVAADVMSFFYASYTLSNKGKETLLNETLKLFEKYKQSDGTIIFYIPQARFTARKK